jgi:hypothetical protein
LLPALEVGTPCLILLSVFLSSAPDIHNGTFQQQKARRQTSGFTIHIDPRSRKRVAPMTQITTHISPRPILGPEDTQFLKSLEDFCEPVDSPRPSSIAALVIRRFAPNRMAPHSTDHKNVAIQGPHGLELLSRDDHNDRCNLEAAAYRKIRSAQFGITSGLLQPLDKEEFNRRRTFGGRPDFLSFVAPQGVVSIVGDLRSDAETRAFSTGLLTHQNCVDSVFQIYTPKPNSAHEKIANLERFDKIKPLARAVLQSFGRPYLDLLKLM